MAILPARKKEASVLRKKGNTSRRNEPILGHTLVDILYDTAQAFTHPNMFNSRDGDGWKTLSLEGFVERVEHLALGLLELGLDQGDRVALYMDSDADFGLADFGSLLAGLIDVPIYLKQSPGANEFILRHSGARALFVSNLARLRDVGSLLAQAPDIETVIVANPEKGETMTPLPQGVRWLSVDKLCSWGEAAQKERPERIRALRTRISPGDLATIVYTSGTTGEPKGVMLTHENLSSNALTAFTELGDTRKGPDGEVVISFLPMSHIFARTMCYATFAYGLTTYFTTPDRLAEDLKEVRPTVFATVPRVLEKVYGNVLERVSQTDGLKRKLANWSLDLADAYEIGKDVSAAQRIKLSLADAVMFNKWRAALGGRVKYIIAGGAAVSPKITNVFAAAGIKILQGYGLTETSPVISFNRPDDNRAGTVGTPLPGVEVRIAEDGEILTRGPHVMRGYFRNPEKTRDVLTEDGWFHTGDIGQITEEGHIRITDRKKDLFKLSTGKYVMPQPLENKLTSHPLVEQAVVVGSGYKFCAALLFVDQDKLRIFADSQGLGRDIPIERLVQHPKILKRYQELVELANEGMDHWSTIKHFDLLLDHLSIDNGMLTPTLKVKRRKIQERFSEHIQSMYEEAERLGAGQSAEMHNIGEKERMQMNVHTP